MRNRTESQGTAPKGAATKDVSGGAAPVGGRYRVGELVQTMFDTGAFGLRVLYGEVIAAGPKVCRIRWESGITNRVPHDYGDVERAKDQEFARSEIARATGAAS